MTALAVVLWTVLGLGVAGAVITMAPKAIRGASRWMVAVLVIAIVAVWPVVLFALGLISIVGIAAAVGLRAMAGQNR